MLRNPVLDGWFLKSPVKGSVAFGLGLGYLAVGVASLVPGPYRPSTIILPDSVEHALAYLLIGALSVVAARITELTPAARLASLLAAYAGVLEICQALIPGRVASVEDFLASTMGAVIGISIATFSRRQQRLARRRDTPPQRRPSCARSGLAEPV